MPFGFNEYEFTNDPLVSKYAQPNTTGYQLKSNFFQLSDINSPLYEIFQRRLQNTLASTTPTTASLLSVLRASGVGYGASQAIAGEQREAIEARNREAAQTGVLDIFTQGQGLANQAGSVASQHFLGKEGYEDQRRANRQERRDAWTNSLINTGIGAAFLAFGGGAGGGIGGAGTSGMVPFRAPGQDPNYQYWRQG